MPGSSRIYKNGGGGVDGLNYHHTIFIKPIQQYGANHFPKLTPFSQHGEIFLQILPSDNFDKNPINKLTVRIFGKNFSYILSHDLKFKTPAAVDPFE
jgi:hypothetical protein